MIKLEKARLVCVFVCYYVWLWINACMSYFVVCCVCQGDRGFVSVHYPNVSVFYKLVAYEQSCLYAQCPGGYLATCVLLLRCVCHSLWGLLRVCAHLGDCECVHSCKGVCLHMLRSWEQSVAGLSVPPDITLLSFGADPAAEVGRPTALLL